MHSDSPGITIYEIMEFEYKLNQNIDLEFISSILSRYDSQLFFTLWAIYWIFMLLNMYFFSIILLNTTVSSSIEIASYFQLVTSVIMYWIDNSL